jgi:hypothetical protein
LRSHVIYTISVVRRLVDLISAFFTLGVIGGKGIGHSKCFFRADLYLEAERFPLISLVELVIIAERVA